MNSADVFSLEFDSLVRTSSLANVIERFRGSAVTPVTHRQLLLELNHVINVHSRLKEVAAEVRRRQRTRHERTDEADERQNLPPEKHPRQQGHETLAG